MDEFIENYKVTMLQRGFQVLGYSQTWSSSSWTNEHLFALVTVKTLASGHKAFLRLSFFTKYSIEVQSQDFDLFDSKYPDIYNELIELKKILSKAGKIIL